MKFDELFTKLKVNPLKLIESIVHADGSSLGDSIAGTGLADLCRATGLSCFCLYGGRRLFSHAQL